MILICGGKGVKELDLPYKEVMGYMVETEKSLMCLKLKTVGASERCIGILIDESIESDIEIEEEVRKKVKIYGSSRELLEYLERGGVGKEERELEDKEKEGIEYIEEECEYEFTDYGGFEYIGEETELEFVDYEYEDEEKEKSSQEELEKEIKRRERVEEDLKRVSKEKERLEREKEEEVKKLREGYKKEIIYTKAKAEKEIKELKARIEEERGIREEAVSEVRSELEKELEEKEKELELEKEKGKESIKKIKDLATRELKKKEKELKEEQASQKKKLEDLERALGVRIKVLEEELLKKEEEVGVLKEIRDALEEQVKEESVKEKREQGRERSELELLRKELELKESELRLKETELRIKEKEIKKEKKEIEKEGKESKEVEKEIISYVKDPKKPLKERKEKEGESIGEVKVLASGGGESTYLMLSEVKELLKERSGLLVIDYTNDTYLKTMLKIKGVQKVSIRLKEEGVGVEEVSELIGGNRVIPSNQFNDISLMSIEWKEMLKKVREEVGEDYEILVLLGDINTFVNRYVCNELSKKEGGLSIFVKSNPLVLKSLWGAIKYLPKETKARIVALDYVKGVDKILTELGKTNEVERVEGKINWLKVLR